MTNLSYAATYLFEKSQSADATKLLQIQNNIEDIIFDYSRRTNKDGFVRLHIILAEYYFGVVIQDNEVVHHKNGNKQCNVHCWLIHPNDKQLQQECIWHWF